ncbi:MAG: DUF624 domain-containing protein [Clostridia bacterium]|nr:DUF624 domain-containing protein [Clostridia bacterium]
MAGFFGLFDYSKEGPGVSKNAPKKRSFVVFFEIYGRKFWKLICAGLLHLLVSLPLVTRGWADAGLTFVTRNYAREKHAFIKEDFFETIKKNRGQAFACGIINLLVTGLLIFNIFYYLTAMLPGIYTLFGVDAANLQPMEPTVMDYVVMAATMFGYIVFTWMKYYIPFLVVTFKLRTKQVYKNAFIFAVAGLKPNLLISVVLLAVYVLLIGTFLLLPYGLTLAIVLMLYVLLVPGFRSFLIQFCIFPTIKKLMIDPYYKENPDADKQARLDLNLEVEEETPAPEDEPVFSDEIPVAAEETNIPRQYSEREMRSFNRRVQGGRDDDDDTI